MSTQTSNFDERTDPANKLSGTRSKRTNGARGSSKSLAFGRGQADGFTQLNLHSFFTTAIKCSKRHSEVIKPTDSSSVSRVQTPELFSDENEVIQVTGGAGDALHADVSGPPIPSKRLCSSAKTVISSKVTAISSMDDPYPLSNSLLAHSSSTSVNVQQATTSVSTHLAEFKPALNIRVTNVRSVNNCKQFTNLSKKACPQYKRIRGTNYAVDAFSYGYIPTVEFYFLSHFHWDHYEGLNCNFRMPIYCSKVTANLVRLQLKMSSEYLRVLPLNEVSLLPGGDTVILFDSHHCPGAVMFYFRLTDGRTILHTGDVRADCNLSLEPLLMRPIDELYLDTTYMDPLYTFPSQTAAVCEAVRLVRDHLSARPKSLVVVGSYALGKERVFLSIAKEFNVKIAVTTVKLNMLRCLENTELTKRLTLNGKETWLHVQHMNQLSYPKLAQYLKKFPSFDNVLAVCPTGWEFTKNRYQSTSGPVCIKGVPYSEHSSFEELKVFVQTLQPRQVIPTVYGNAKHNASMFAELRAWRTC